MTLIKRERPTDELLELARIEDNNFQANIRMLGDVLVAFDHVFRLHGSFTSFVEKAAMELGENPYLAINNFCQLIAQDLLKGMNSLCKGYLTDSSFHLRRSIESAACLIEISKNPTKADIWSAMEEDEQIVEYVKNFMVYKLVKNNMSPKVIEQYETLCLSVHPSALSMAHRTNATEGGIWTIRFFDVDRVEDIPHVKMMILNLLTTHRLILDDMAAAFASSPSFDFQSYEPLSEQVYAIWKEITGALLTSGELSIPSHP